MCPRSSLTRGREKVENRTCTRALLVPPTHTHSCYSEYFETDTLHLEEHFDSWHQPHASFPFMSLRYETERDNMALLQKFLGLSREISLPAKNKKIAGSVGKVPRSERLARLTETQRAALARTYGRIQQKAKAAPDSCLWES